MPTKHKPQTQSDYVSDRVFDGVRKLSPARAAQLRASYLNQKDQAEPAKRDGKPAKSSRD